MFRAIFEHVAPIIGGIKAILANTANHMAQIEFGYRENPISEDQGAHGQIKAGDRIPELTVRYRGADWSAARLIRNQGDHFDPGLADSVSIPSVPIQVVEIAESPGGAGGGYALLFGGESDVYLVRPDGYVALAEAAKEAPEALRNWCGRWLTRATSAKAK